MKQTYNLVIGPGAWNTQPENMPDKKGIYFVYRCKTKVDDNGKVVLDKNRKPVQCLDKLLYIGESGDVRRRMKDHNRDDDVRTKDVPAEEALYYAFAPFDGTDDERIRLESAIIFYHREVLPKGVGNKKNTKTFPYDETTVVISGKYTFGLSTSFVQPRVDRPEE